VEWYEDWGHQATDWSRIGEGDSVAQNPPSLEGSDQFAWDWYWKNCTRFAREYGLIPGLITRLEMRAADEAVFLKKMDAINEMALRIAEREAEKKRR